MAVAQELQKQLPKISRDEIRTRLGDPDLILVNVLPRNFFEESHIPGSISLPLNELPERAAEVLPERGKELAVYCGGFS